MELEALVWNRERTDDAVITVNRSTQETLIDGEDLDPGYEPGVRATFGWAPDQQQGFEISGFWLNGQSESETASLPLAPGPVFPSEPIQVVGSFLIPTLQGFRGDWRHEVELKSELWGLEANYIRAVDIADGVEVDLLGGLRYVRFDEDFDLHVLDNDPGRPTQFISDWDLDTSNNMFGAQIGVAVSAPLTDWVSLGFDVKGGVFANRAKIENSYVDGEVNLSDSFSKSEWGVAGLVQAGLGLTFPITPGIEAGFGYEVFYIDGVALAPDNFRNSFLHAEFGNRLKVDSSGSALYHGANAHVRIRF